jgi:hypothetical protein
MTTRIVYPLPAGVPQHGGDRNLAAHLYPTQGKKYRTIKTGGVIL